MVLTNIRAIMENGASAITIPSVLFREIHKNGVLKKYNSEKRTGFPRKAERVWAVFCVHDDTEAFLEVYPEHKAALTHHPDWFVSLQNALHVSPSICGSSDEYEFAVTLPTQVVRLAASTWDLMMEWVETIRNKLRELRVLAPKENVYSKMPEQRHGVLTTRDPTSPLPLPPVGPRGLVPGVESPVRNNAPSEGSSDVPPGSTEAGLAGESSLLTRRNESAVLRQRRLASDNATDQVIILTDLNINTPAGEIVPPEGETPIIHSHIQSESNFQGRNTPPLGGSSVVVVRNGASSADSSSSDECCQDTNNASNHHGHAMALPSTSNVTVIEVAPQSPHYEHLFTPSLVNLPVPHDSRSKLERVSSSGLIPRVPSRAKRDATDEQRAREQPITATAMNGISESANAAMSSPNVESPHTSIVRVKSLRETSAQTSVVRLVPGNSVSVVSVEAPVSSGKVHHPSSSNHVIPPMTAAFQPVPSNVDVKDIPLIGGHQRRRRRSSSSEVGAQGVPATRGLGGADLIRTVVANEAAEPQLISPPLTLRVTQVCQLLKEISHPGGVRLKLRRKDCFGAIALVDVFSSVWVAGWKQREHPLLYNALHVGDQLLSVADTPVRTASEAHKLLKGPSAAMPPIVELVVRRLPLARVLTLEREHREGGVGVIPDMGAPGEVTVEPGGVAARAGLPLCAPSWDGLALTTWTLTEVNGRPLNLFCKAADVSTRLNSVGKELSILVQPSDFIKQVKKQLKSLKSYKEYLLQ